MEEGIGELKREIEQVKLKLELKDYPPILKDMFEMRLGTLEMKIRQAEALMQDITDFTTNWSPPEFFIEIKKKIINNKKKIIN